MTEQKNNVAVWGREGHPLQFFNKIKYFNIIRNIKRVLPKHLTPANTTIMDAGCGYNADFLHILAPLYAKAIGLDFEVNPKLKENSKLCFLEGDLAETITMVEDSSVDLIIFSSVLEHMDDPLAILKEGRRILKPGGRVFYSCPTWLGKWVLENILCTKLFDPNRETPEQINSHKMYYWLKDMWPIVVKAGFVSTEVKIWYTNFFCNTVGYAEKTMPAHQDDN